MSEQLIKRLRNREHEIDCSLCDRDCCYQGGKVHGKCIIIEAAEVIEDLEFACNRYEKDYKDLCSYLPRWIPVTEGFPPAGKEVYVTDGEYISRANLLDEVFPGDKPCWSYSGLGEITHWCEQIPLPK